MEYAIAAQREAVDTVCPRSLDMLSEVPYIQNPEIRRIAIEHIEELEQMMKANQAQRVIIDEIREKPADGTEKFESLKKSLEKKTAKKLGKTALPHEARFAEVKAKLTQQPEQPEEEMVVMQMTYSKKDPITKKDIEKPVKNKFCGHVYDSDSVEAFIKDNKARRMAVYRCPYIGCANKTNLKMEDFEDFPQFFELCA